MERRLAQRGLSRASTSARNVGASPRRVLAIQGEDDPYGTMAQIEEIAARAPQTRLLRLPGCGHSPHKDQPEAVNEAIRQFLAGL
jgi:pimeloyl-ACP methyl ester carboxylesterase